ncbi:MAG: hypothetical protein GF364_14380 [Candidatus Lokiarchaeota archaeon]|nr:hypothetical protein [Candidatus Lokiarchaeota archaeon]
MSENGYNINLNAQRERDGIKDLMNQKSKFIVKLNQSYEYYKSNKAKDLREKIVDAETKIIDLIRRDEAKSKQKRYNKLMFISLISAINTMFYFHPQEALKLALKGIIDTKIEDNKKDILFLYHQDLIKSSNKPTSLSQFFLDIILEQYIQQDLHYNEIKFNKTPLYIFSNFDYNSIKLIELSPRKISTYPLYSPELSKYIKNLQKQHIFHIKENRLIEGINYEIIQSKARIYEYNIQKRIIEKIKQLVNEFSHFDVDEITEWEKKTHILDYFETDSRII